MKLSKRLKTIADMVPAGITLADIGTDHAYLPIYLVQEKIVTRAVAGDVHQGPYLSAKNAVAVAGLEQYISVRLGNGLDVVTPGEVDTITIAGMGGTNIIDILSAKPQVTERVKRLILQPMIGAASVRSWLLTHGRKIIDEQLVQEDGTVYQIIAAELGRALPLAPVLYEIGPVLWESRHPLLKIHIAGLISHLTRVLAAMSASTEALNSAKYQEFACKLKELEEKYACL